MRHVEPLPGYEFRGFVIRLYPDQELIQQLYLLQDQLRSAWNWLVKQTEEALEATRSFAVRYQLVGPRPVRPDYTGMPSDVAKKTRVAFRQACADWNKAVYDATKNIPGCGPRKFREFMEHFGADWNYQLISKVVGWRGYERACNSSMMAALVKNYFTKSERRKKFKRKQDHMPLQVRSGECFRLGDFGTRRGNPFYNCEVVINGLHIRGRLPGMTPRGRVLEGVTITERADGWYAAIKVELPIRVPAKAMPGTVAGIDVGLNNLAAIVDNAGVAKLVTSPRGHELARIIARRQQEKQSVGKLHLKASRHNMHVIYNEIIKPLSTHEVINVERLSSKIGQMGSELPSSMRTIYRLLVERYGERVREVDPAFTSQDCSQCGFRSKDSWSYAHGPYGLCPACGFTEHRDINAARNIAAK